MYLPPRFFLAAIVGIVAIILAGWLFLRMNQTPQPKNSELFGQRSQLESREPALSLSKATILFGGDMQFDRYIRDVIDKHGGTFVFDGLRPEFQKADLVVANLEGPITDMPSVSEASVEGSRNNYTFTFPVETAGLLKQENISLVNIGNNHILNFKHDGVRQTKESLERAGVDYFGSPLSTDERVHIRTISSIRIGFVNYNEFIWRGREKVIEDIALVKDQTDFIVVYAHWGKEYVEATREMRVLGHEFIDSGADLVIGSHPHVVQATEEYRGKRIYYSLGNLIFDQYFRPETQSGLVIRAVFDLSTKRITFAELPILLKTNGQTEFAER